MTAEIAILNRSAVAMAADSAVTMSLGIREKIFPTANKIFALSATEPIGIMVYGGANYMGVPWETVIKILRQRLADRRLPHLTDYAEWFRSTITKSKDLIIGSATKDYVMQCVGSYFAFLQEEATEHIDAFIEEHKEITEDQVVRLLSDLISEHASNWRDGEPMTGVGRDAAAKVRRIIKSHVESLIDMFFSKLPISTKAKRELHFVAEAIFTRRSKLQRVSDSGVVIAGFGESEIVPALTSMEIRGAIDDVLQWRQVHKISMETSHYGVIVPFAQTDEVQNFLDGIHPDFLQRLDQDFQQILEKATDIILDEIKGPSRPERIRAKAAATRKLRAEYAAYRAEVRNFRREQYSDPILQVLAGTPKDQMASMAEALVNMTSFKRRVSLDSETVGGPVDVALISKGDGLVWVKRKHYFPSELNHQFFARYNRELS